MKNFDEFFLSNLTDLKKEVATKNPSSKFQKQDESQSSSKKVMTLADYKEQIKQQHSKPLANEVPAQNPGQIHAQPQTASAMQQPGFPSSMYYGNYPAAIQTSFYNQQPFMFPQPSPSLPMVNPSGIGMMPNFYSNPPVFATSPLQQYHPTITPGMGISSQTPIHLTPSEETYYRKLYSTMPDRQLSGDLPAKKVVDFLKTSKLPKERLKEFWLALNKPANRSDIGVSQSELFLLLKMIALEQNKIEPSPQSLLSPGFFLLPVFYNVEEEDAFETFQVAGQATEEEDFGEFEHGSPLVKEKVQSDKKSERKVHSPNDLLGDDAFEEIEAFDPRKDDPIQFKTDLQLNKVEGLLNNYDKYNVFDEIQDKKEPTLSTLNMEIIANKNEKGNPNLFQNQLVQNPKRTSPDENIQNKNEIYNQFRPDIQKKTLEPETEEEFFDFQEGEKQIQGITAQNLGKNLMNFGDLQSSGFAFEKPVSNTDEFMEFQGMQTTQGKQNIENLMTDPKQNEKFNLFQIEPKEQSQSQIKNEIDFADFKSADHKNENDFMEFQSTQMKNSKDIDLMEFESARIPKTEENNFMEFQDKKDPDLMEFETSQSKKNDDFMEFQTDQKKTENDFMEVLAAPNKTDDYNFMEFQANHAKKDEIDLFQTSEVKNHDHNNFMEFQTSNKEEDNDFMEFQTTQNKAESFGFPVSSDLPIQSDQQKLNLLLGQNSNFQMTPPVDFSNPSQFNPAGETTNQPKISVSKGNIFEIDWNEAEPEGTSVNPQLASDFKAIINTQILPTREDGFQITTDRKEDEDFEWVEGEPGIQSEKPRLVTKKTEDLIDFGDDVIESSPERPDTTLKSPPEGNWPTGIESSDVFGWRESVILKKTENLIETNLMSSDFNWGSPEGFGSTIRTDSDKNIFEFGNMKKADSENIKDVLEGNVSQSQALKSSNETRSNNIKDLLEGNFATTAPRNNSNENPNITEEDEFEWNEAPKTSAPLDVFQPIEVNSHRFEEKKQVENLVSLNEANKFDEFDFKWNEDSNISPPKGNQTIGEKTVLPNSSANHRDVFQYSQAKISGINLLDLLSQVESLIPSVKILNLLMFSGTAEEISDLAEAVFSLEMYEECEALIQHHKLLLELSSCEAEKKRLIAEERYEDVITIRDRVKKLEKQLMTKERVEEIKGLYESSNGKTFSSVCLDRLTDLEAAENLIETFKRFIEKTAENSGDLKTLKEIRAQKNAFVELFFSKKLN